MSVKSYQVKIDKKKRFSKYHSSLNFPRNEVNQCSDFWQWHVSSPPRVIKKIGEERICNEKETVTLTVETEADPAPTVTW